MADSSGNWPTPDGWRLLHAVYDDAPGGIGVALLSDGEHTMLGLRWHQGNEHISSWPGQPTGYFLVPFTFAAAIARSLLMVRSCGNRAGFDEAGVDALIGWLAQRGAVDDALCY